MITIKSIHIKNFRSIVDETINLTDFNFFVGKNDSGKSNVLKALNLFFNGKTDFDTEFNFSDDYSQFAKRGAKQAKEIVISLDIIVPDTFMEKGVKTWTKVWRAEGLHDDNLKKIFKGGSKGFTLLDRVQYMYIPAVKSNAFFRYLLSEVYTSMTKTADSTLENLNGQYSEQLQVLTNDLSEQLKAVLNINSAIQMPQNLNVLFQDLTFTTSDKYVDGVDLNHRGDGIKARHIPSILWYMQKNFQQNRLKNTIRSTFIWGFEEPENGVEYLSCFEMADELYSYRKECQILVTTHSPAFYLKHDEADVSCFFTYKQDNGASKYDAAIPVEDINEKIGFMPLVAPYIKHEHEQYIAKEKALRDELQKAIQKFDAIVGKIIIITEGKTDKKHIITAFKALQLDPAILAKINYYEFGKSSTLGDELNDLLLKLSRLPNANVIIGIFDRDKHILESTDGKRFLTLNNNVYKFSIPAIENEERKTDDKICIEHYYSNAEITAETEYGHLYMAKDFNEFGISSDGHWIFKDYAKNKSITPLSIIDESNPHLQKHDADAHIITKDVFADYVVSHPEEFDFKNFRGIYDVICEIIEDSAKHQAVVT